MSHAVCVRGLKQLDIDEEEFKKQSHAVCHPKAGKRAWIETVASLNAAALSWSHAVCVRGLKLK